MAEVWPAMSAEVARELYPTALRQARTRCVVTGCMAAVVVLAAALGWLAFGRDAGPNRDGDFLLRTTSFSLLALLLGIVEFARWRRLKRLTPEQAAAAKLL